MERNRLGTSTLKILFGIAMFSIVASYAVIRDTSGGGGALTPVSVIANPCPRSAAGSAVHNAPALFSPGTTADNDLGPAELRGHANGQILG
jgi:hypothetical protein